MTFTGIPLSAPGFYADLEQHNTREWWLTHKQRYVDEVRAPMEHIATSVAPVFGEAKLFRPNRDVRFSNDKSPYKTQQGLWVRTPQGAGYYLHLDADGLMLGGGAYQWASDQVARFRAAVANEASGVQLVGILRELTDAGYEVGGDALKRVPRGFSADSPRADLLRHKTLYALLRLGTPEWMATPDVAEYVNDGWDEVRDLVGWIDQFVGPSEPD